MFLSPTAMSSFIADSQQPQGRDPDERMDVFGHKPLPYSLGHVSKASYL